MQIMEDATLNNKQHVTYVNVLLKEKNITICLDAHIILTKM